MATPHEKQVMMFSGTMKEEDKSISRKFMQDPVEITIQDNTKLVLNGLKQFYVSLMDSQKLPQLVLILEQITYNQVIIFVNKIIRANALSKYLKDKGFVNETLHRDIDQEARNKIFLRFKENEFRILVATDLCGRGIDVVRVNLVINFDIPETEEDYMHRIGRAGRFDTSGLAISFSATNEDKHILDNLNKDFSVKIKELPKELNTMTD